MNHRTSHYAAAPSASCRPYQRRRGGRPVSFPASNHAFAMDGTDASISGGVVTNDMCSSWRKQADPAAGRGYGGTWVRPVSVYTDDALEWTVYIL